MWRGWLERARALKREVAMLLAAAHDPRLPWPVKLLALAVVAYALSPIDLIPDFIPVLGHLDDVILVPLGIWLVVRLIPPAILAEHRAAAAAAAGGSRPPRSLAGAAVIAALWLAAAVWLGSLALDWFQAPSPGSGTL
jgi:uncharacterized membrane protein YkvA (DUF1232 family)